MIAIRRAGAADAAALNQIVHTSRSHKGEYSPMLDSYEITPAQIARDEIHLAEQDGAVVGFYSLMLGDAPELDLMFIHDSAHGLGLGRQLFGHMRALAKEKGVSAVKIVSHPPAAGFYRKMGAVEAGVAFPMGRVTWPRPIFVLPTG